MNTKHTRDFTLQEGVILSTPKTEFCIESIHGDEVILRDIKFSERKLIKKSLLLTSFSTGEITYSSRNDEDLFISSKNSNDNQHLTLSQLPLADLSEAQLSHVLTVIKYVRALRELGYTSLCNDSPAVQRDIDKLSKSFGDSCQVKRAWLYKWWLILEKANDDPRALVPKFNDRGGANKSRIDPEHRNAIDAAIAQHLEDTKSRLRTVDVKNTTLILLRANGSKDGFENISSSTVDRAIRKNVSPYTLCVRRKGKAHADRKYRHWYPRDKAQMALEVVETDDVDTAIFLVDDKSGLPFGRGWLTSVIDQFSKPLLGWELSEQPRSLWSACRSLVNAILPNNTSLQDFSTSNEPAEFYGRPGVVVFDNALYNHANAIEIYAAEMGFTPAWAKPKTPTEKTVIENFHRILKQDFLCNLPGWRGNIKEREGLAEGMASANMNLHEFRQQLVKWISDDYSNTPQGKGFSPRQSWHESMRHIKPRVPLDIHGLKIIACIPSTIRLRPEGILFHGLIYSAPALQTMRKKFGHNIEVVFKYNPGDLGYIYVFEPELKTYFAVVADDFEYALDLTLFQHKLILKLARENKIKNPKINDLLKYREELRILTHQLRYSKKVRERKLAKRAGDIPANEQVTAHKKSNSGPLVQTELEFSISEIDAIEFELNEAEWELPEDF